MRESFPYKRALREERLLEQTKRGKLFGFVQSDIEVPEELKKKFANFSPIFKNTNVSPHDFGLLMKDYGEKERLLCQPRNFLISSFFLENGTLINKFVHSAVNARRERDENPNSSAVAETMKRLANSSYGYLIVDRTRHTVTK